MAARGGWVFAPDSGGVRIPDPVKHRTEARLRRYDGQNRHHKDYKSGEKGSENSRIGGEGSGGI